MSYILEALKKSEYARQQGRVADLATRAPVEVTGSAALAAERLPLLASGALLLAIAVAGWWRPWQVPQIAVTLPAETRPSVAAQAEMRAVTPAAARLAAPLASAQPSAPPPAAAAVATPSPQPQPPTPAAAVVPTPPPPAPKAVLPALAPAPLPAQAQAAVAPVADVPRPAEPAPTSALPAPPRQVLAFYELPTAVRERLPRLTVSGFSYAEQPDLRLAVINDKVLRQGEDAAPGIVLERIASDGVVLNFAGYRFRPQR